MLILCYFVLLGLLWLTFDDVNGIRATALIFGKSTTTTTSTTPQPENVSEEEVKIFIQFKTSLKFVLNKFFIALSWFSV